MFDRMQPEELAIAAAVLAAGVILIFASGWGFARSISGLLATATDFTRQIAAGNLSTPLPSASLRDEIGALKFSLEVMRKSLVSITRDVHDGIESALHSASEIADGNEDLSAHTQRQAAALDRRDGGRGVRRCGRQAADLATLIGRFVIASQCRR
ncbi:hypothetical protein G6F65_019999 [Rhizopus arrhizus]|nr:hypothetical protein G6F65_019999 [Rhizopus arrhizus]